MCACVLQRTMNGDVSVDDGANQRPSDDVTAEIESRDHRDDDDVTLDAAAAADHDSAFRAGFRDCRRAALRYLRRRGDPAVCDELERHLANAERRSTCRAAEGPRDDSALGDSVLDDDGGEEEAAGATSSELGENARELLRLALDNPRINNILNELFALMDHQHQHDDDDDDDVEDCAMMTSSCDDADSDDVRQQTNSSADTMTSRDAVADVS